MNAGARRVKKVSDSINWNPLGWKKSSIIMVVSISVILVVLLIVALTVGTIDAGTINFMNQNIPNTCNGTIGDYIRISKIVGSGSKVKYIPFSQSAPGPCVSSSSPPSSPNVPTPSPYVPPTPPPTPSPFNPFGPFGPFGAHNA